MPAIIIIEYLPCGRSAKTAQKWRRSHAMIVTLVTTASASHGRRKAPGGPSYAGEAKSFNHGGYFLLQ